MECEPDVTGEGYAAGSVRHTIRRIADWLAFVRISTCAGMVLQALLGAFLGGAGNTSAWLRAGLASVSMGAVMAAANSFNDIVDLETDRIDKMCRPLPAARISHRSAVAFLALLVVLALGSAIPIGGALAGATGVLLILALGYSVVFKGKVPVGNSVAVAVVSAAAIPYGAVAAVGGLPPLPCLLAWVASMLFVFAYDNLKTAMDIRGDASAGLRTIATVRGLAVSVSLSKCAMAGVIAVMTAGAVIASSAIYLPVVAVVIVLPLIALASRLGPDLGSIRAVARGMWLLWFPALAALCLLR